MASSSAAETIPAVGQARARPGGARRGRGRRRSVRAAPAAPRHPRAGAGRWGCRPRSRSTSVVVRVDGPGQGRLVELGLAHDGAGRPACGGPPRSWPSRRWPSRPRRRGRGRAPPRPRSGPGGRRRPRPGSRGPAATCGRRGVPCRRRSTPTSTPASRRETCRPPSSAGAIGAVGHRRGAHHAEVLAGGGEDGGHGAGGREGRGLHPRGDRAVRPHPLQSQDVVGAGAQDAPQRALREGGLGQHRLAVTAALEVAVAGLLVPAHVGLERDAPRA